MTTNQPDPKELIRQGNLAEARALLVARLKQQPADTGARTLLFQVLLFLGERDKARQHLEALSRLASEQGPALMLCHSLLHCEAERQRVLAFQALPSYLPGTPEYFTELYPCFRPGGAEDGQLLEAAAAGRIPQVQGTVNGESFSGLRNADDLPAYALEVYAHDRSLWVPFEAIREILVQPPASLLDLYWLPASVTTWSGLSLNGHLPVLYADSWRHPDPLVRLGRMTDWVAGPGGLVRGAGQQLFLFGERDLPLLEIREVRFTMGEGAQQATLP